MNTRYGITKSPPKKRKEQLNNRQVQKSNKLLMHTIAQEISVV